RLGHHRGDQTNPVRGGWVPAGGPPPSYPRVAANWGAVTFFSPPPGVEGGGLFFHGCFCVFGAGGGCPPATTTPTLLPPPPRLPSFPLASFIAKPPSLLASIVQDDLTLR